jgi:hypothetical protein
MTYMRLETPCARYASDLGGWGRSPEECLFARARDGARRDQIWSNLLGRPRRLYAFAQVTDACTIDAQVDGGLRTVPISRIWGSTGRSTYFDREFQPLYDKARARWLSIARARLQGKHLPPVSLISIGDVYSVTDGHHRISVARALGQSNIEARVTIWHVTGPLPWDARRAQPGTIPALTRLRQQAALVLETVLAASRLV